LDIELPGILSGLAHLYISVSVTDFGLREKPRKTK